MITLGKNFGLLWGPVLILFLLSLGSLSRLQAALENWESNNGHSVKAEFVRITDGAVELKKEDGALIQVPIVRLSEASRTRAESLWKEKSRFAPLHVFNMQTYDLSLFDKGRVELQPKHAGRPQGDPVKIHFNGGYSREGKGWQGRNIARMSEPVIGRNTLSMEMVLDDEVELNIEYELGVDTLSVGFQVKEPAGIDEGFYQIMVLMPAILETNPDTKLLEGSVLPQPSAFDSIDPFLKGIAVRLVAENDSKTIGFNESTDEFKGKNRSILVTGSLGSNSKFKVDSGKNGYLGQWIYDGKMLWSGFHLFLKKNNNADPAMGSSNEFKLKLTY